MTYCLGIRVKEGLIGLSDGRLTAGNQVTTGRKLSLHGPEQTKFMVMTSGLRSVRDKTVAYLDLTLADGKRPPPRTMLDCVTLYGECLRRVAQEDREALAQSNLVFDLHTIIGGRLPGDKEATQFLIYPEGNWIEISERTPYLSTGSTTYGKPILDRTLRYETSLSTALKLAFLSFDSTRFSSANVGFPIDLVTLPTGESQWRLTNFDYDDLLAERQWWNEHITKLAMEMPDGPWVDALVPQAAAAAGGLSLVKGEKS